MPSPMYSGTQVQVKLPGVLVQLASELQPPLFTAHSSISTSSQGDVEWNSWTEVKEVQYVVQENRSLLPQMLGSEHTDFITHSRLG